MKKIFGWLKESNRLKHLQCGLVIAVVLFATGMIAKDIFDDVFKVISIGAFEGTFLCMCSVEFIQKHAKIGIWDWKDIIAGSILPFLFMVGVLIFG